MKNRRLMLLAILLTVVGSIFADNLTVSSVELKAGNSQDVTISLISTSKKYTAFQFDIVLPECVSIAKNDKGNLMATLNDDRIDDHTLTVQYLGSNTYRFLCFSMTNAEFYGTSGALVNITLQTDENVSVGMKEGLIESQVFTEIDGSQVKWDDVSFSISIKEAGPAVIKGDVNGDGEVNVADLVAVSNYMAGDDTVSKEKADVNSDGEVNVADLVAISNIMSGNAE